jgi:hypothetical protein
MHWCGCPVVIEHVRCVMCDRVSVKVGSELAVASGYSSPVGPEDFIASDH